jgi:Flp pilus assembly protein CpaB
MLWEASILVFCLSFGFGVAALMARKIKNVPPVIQQVHTQEGINIEEIIARVAVAVGEQISNKLKEALKDLPAGSVRYHEGKSGNTEIHIDEHIIPTNITIEEVEKNLEQMATVETQVDSDLDNAKSKLASLLKKKKG